MLCNCNAEIEEENMNLFRENYNIKSLIKQPTCFKNHFKPTCIDLILAYVPDMFKVHVYKRQDCLIFI